MTPFRAYGAVILDGSGDGTITLGPVPAGEVWRVNRMAIQITGGVTGNLGAECRVYRGTANPANFFDGSTRAGLDVSELPNPMILTASESLTFVFSGATAGAQATAAVDGVR